MLELLSKSDADETENPKWSGGGGGGICGNFCHGLGDFILGLDKEADRGTDEGDLALEDD